MRKRQAERAKHGQQKRGSYGADGRWRISVKIHLHMRDGEHLLKQTESPRMTLSGASQQPTWRREQRRGHYDTLRVSDVEVSCRNWRQLLIILGILGILGQYPMHFTILGENKICQTTIWPHSHSQHTSQDIYS